MSANGGGKIAVVTGSSEGLGACIALIVAAEDAAVAVNYSTSQEGAEHIVGEMTLKVEKPVPCEPTSRGNGASGVSSRLQSKRSVPWTFLYIAPGCISCTARRDDRGAPPQDV